MNIQDKHYRRLDEYAPGTVVRDGDSCDRPFYIVTDRKDADGRIWIVKLKSGQALTADGASKDFEPYFDAMLLPRYPE